MGPPYGKRDPGPSGTHTNSHVFIGILMGVGLGKPSRKPKLDKKPSSQIKTSSSGVPKHQKPTRPVLPANNPFAQALMVSETHTSGTHTNSHGSGIREGSMGKGYHYWGSLRIPLIT